MSADVHRSRLFFGICLALIPTGASFALVSNILVPLKQQFILTNYQVGLIGGAALWGMAISLLVMGPLLEAFGLKNGARLAFLGHVTGVSLMLLASTRTAGDPFAFTFLMIGAATLAAGNGMIEVTGNPLAAALYPDEKTKRLNWFHAFFPIGLIFGGLVGFALGKWGGAFGRWPYQLAVLYIPMVVYAVMVLPQAFPKTENAEKGLPVKEMFRFTLTSPLFILMLCMMAITVSMELGPMRWIPSVLTSAGVDGILVLVWISGWMMVLRFFAGHAVEKLQPTGMLLLASILTGTGLFLLSFATGKYSAFGAATIFAWGVAFFFPTMVGVVSEKLPRTGSLGIVLLAGVGLGAAGLIGVPTMGKLADRYLAESLPASTSQLLQRVNEKFPAYIQSAQSGVGAGYRQQEVQDALNATRAAIAAEQASGSVKNDATANALRAVVATAIPNEPLIGEANGILQPAEAAGGQRSFRLVAPIALLLILVFGMMYMRDRKQGGYRAVKLEAAAAALLLLAILALPLRGQNAENRPAPKAPPRAENQRLRVLFLGDNGHHRPTQRAKDITPVLAARGIDLFYTDDRDDLNDSELDRYHAIMLYNNHMTVSPSQIAALTRFVSDGGGLVVLHCASASFQNSEEFIRLVGAAFKSHGTGTFSAVRVAADHPAISGVPAFESWDETYVHTKHNPVNRTVLEVRRENGHDEPWTWVRTYGKGRVFYTASGHDQRTWDTPGFQQLVERGVRWTIGGTAMSAVATGPATKLIDLPVPLPTYKRPPAPWNTLDTAITKAQDAFSTRDQLALTTVRPRFSMKPFATEPLIGNIIDFAWDARGRMWAVETNDYPNKVIPDSIVFPSAGPYPGARDRIIILEDVNGDGMADRVKVFAEGLNLATSIAFANGGVVVGQAPHMLFFRDTNGDDKADERTIMFTGFPRGDTHGTISNLRLGFDNQMWGSVGYNGFRGTVGSRTYGRGQFGSGYFRFPVNGSDLEYVARTSNNTWGVAFTEDNFVFGSTANSRPTNFVHIPLRYYRSVGLRDTVLPDISDRLDVFPNRDILQVDQFGRYTAGSAHEIYTARAFPREYWNRMAFVAEPTAHLVGMFELSDNGSGFSAKNRWSFMASRDAWAAPVQVKVGPDGAVWISDFYTLVAQHNPTPRNMRGCCENGPGNAYETPNRDLKLLGRIYKITYDSAPSRVGPPMRLDNATPAQLVRALSNDNMFWRQTAQRLLVERGKTDVVPALIDLVNDHTVDSLGLKASALHALWTLHGLGVLASNPQAMQAARNALNHPAASLRRAALMALPRDQHLLDDIFASGILPDRRSPWPVDYTVGTPILQDADAHVRLEALLVLADVGGAQREAAAISDVITFPGNARDPWLPDAVALAGIKHGPEFLRDLIQRRVPNDSLAVLGMRRSVHKIARHYAGRSDPAIVVNLIGTIPQASAPLAVAMLNGIAEGWPVDTLNRVSPAFTAEQKAALVSVGRVASPDIMAAMDRVAARWNLPNAFKPE